MSELCVLSVFYHSSSSGRIIGAKDHASVQISVAEVNETGTVTGTSKSYAICGFIRSLVGLDTNTDWFCLIVRVAALLLSI